MKPHNETSSIYLSFSARMPSDLVAFLTPKHILVKSMSPPNPTYMYPRKTFLPPKMLVCEMTKCFSPPNGLTGQLLAIVTLYDPPSSLSTNPHSFLKFGVIAALIQTINRSCYMFDYHLRRRSTDLASHYL